MSDSPFSARVHEQVAEFIELGVTAYILNSPDFASGHRVKVVQGMTVINAYLTDPSIYYGQGMQKFPSIENALDYLLMNLRLGTSLIDACKGLEND